MYLNSSGVPAPTPYGSTPVQFSDINTTAQQQQQQQQQQLHYNLINFNAAQTAGLIAPTTGTSSNNNINTNITPSSTQPAPSTNESVQQQLQPPQQQPLPPPPPSHQQQQHQQQQPSLQSSAQSYSTVKHPPVQQILLENLYNNVHLREKSSNQLYDPRKTRKRLSDPVFINPQQSLQPLIINHQQTNLHPTLQQQLAQTNLNISHDANNLTLLRRRSLRFVKPPLVLQTIAQQPSQPPQRELQKLLVVRHAERVDSTFGAGWLDQVFDKGTGTYRRINLNLPKKMVTRRDLKDFLFDPPLTELGLHECKMVGEELAAQGIEIHHVYASPALRCVQTADKILEGLRMRDDISIRIEPCLFEFLKWYPVVPVKWPFLDLDELTRNGYNVDKSYKAFYPMESLRKDEDELMYYTRSHFIMTSILKNHEMDTGNLLIVGHAPSIEVCTRQLTGGQPRVNDLKFLVLRVPFLSMHCIAKQLDGSWRATKPPISPIKHAAVEPFDWRFFR